MFGSFFSNLNFAVTLLNSLYRFFPLFTSSMAGVLPSTSLNYYARNKEKKRQKSSFPAPRAKIIAVVLQIITNFWRWLTKMKILRSRLHLKQQTYKSANLTMNGIINWKPSWNNCSCFTTEQRINIYVHFANGIISTVGIMIKNCDLERLIL